MGSYGKDIRMGDSLITKYTTTQLKTVKTIDRILEVTRILKENLSWAKDVKLFNHNDIPGQYRIEINSEMYLTEKRKIGVGLNLRLTTLKQPVESSLKYPSITWNEITPKD